MKLYKIYQDAPPLGKILLIAAVILLAYLIYRGVKKLIDQAPSKGQVNSATNELKELAQAGEVTHYTESQMKGFADKLFKAMEGVGTDEDQIRAVFKYMQNKADVLELIKTFGVRPYEGLFSVSPYNLTQWLNEELSQDEINLYVNVPLRTAGINYTF